VIIGNAYITVNNIIPTPLLKTNLYYEPSTNRIVNHINQYVNVYTKCGKTPVPNEVEEMSLLLNDIMLSTVP